MEDAVACLKYVWLVLLEPVYEVVMDVFFHARAGKLVMLIGGGLLGVLSSRPVVGMLASKGLEL